MSPYPSTSDDRMAAPVGVTSSNGTPREYIGAPRSSLVEQRSDARVRADHRGDRRVDVDLRGAEPERLDLLPFQRERVERQAAKGLAQGVEVRARVDQRSERHVAGDAGDAVEVGD